MALFERAGAVAVTADCAFDAVQAAAPDLIISDIELPGEDGCALIRRVRALPPPFSHFIGKPAALQDLLAAVDHLLRPERTATHRATPASRGSKASSGGEGAGIHSNFDLQTQNSELPGACLGFGVWSWELTIDRTPVDPLRLAFLGCGFITQVHSRNLNALRDRVACSYASRDPAKAAEYCRAHGGVGSFADYERAIADPGIEAVVVAVPPKFHLELTLRALAAGKHVLVEKPAFLSMDDYRTALAARDRANRVVLVGENDHYKPLAVALRRLLAEDAIGEMVFAHFTTIVRRLKAEDDWRNDESMAGGDAFFEEGIHWLHTAGSLGPKIIPSSVRGYRPPPASGGPDRRQKSLMVAFQYDNGAAAALYYSREIPSLLKGLRLSKLFGRKGIITFESNGTFLLARGQGLPRFLLPGFRDIRGYQAMYRDFHRAIREGGQPEMSLERAMEDQALMERVYATANAARNEPSGNERAVDAFGHKGHQEHKDR